MSTYPAHDLLQQWKRNKLETDQAIGYIIQHLVLLYEQNVNLSNRVAALTKQVETQSSQPPPKGKRKT